MVYLALKFLKFRGALELRVQGNIFVYRSQNFNILVFISPKVLISWKEKTHSKMSTILGLNIAAILASGGRGKLEVRRIQQVQELERWPYFCNDTETVEDMHWQKCAVLRGRRGGTALKGKKTWLTNRRMILGHDSGFEPKNRIWLRNKYTVAVSLSMRDGVRVRTQYPRSIQGGEVCWGSPYNRILFKIWE